jgi:hypothetical protein
MHTSNTHTSNMKRKAAYGMSSLSFAVIWLPVLAVFLFACTGLAAAEADDSWLNLKRVTHDRAYTVVFRDFHCLEGHLLSVSEDSALLRIEPAQELVIQRSQILRVADHLNDAAHAAVFSGRSSWNDVNTADPKGSEYLSVLTKQNQQQRWKKPIVSDDSISGNGKVIPKNEVRLVYYFRHTPLSDSEEYLVQEQGTVFAPRLWFNGNLMRKIGVLLYDSEAQEDDSPIGKKECRP